jgi:transcription elongation factor Elf1
MKIIDETPDPKVVKRISCGCCGVRLEYVPNDVILLWSGKDYSGGSDGAKGFKCPKCGKDVITERW